MDLQPIEARLEAAPEPEKWQVEEGWEGYRVFYKDDGPGDLPIAEGICQGTDGGEALAEFIAHAPEDIRALIAEVKRLEAWKREAVTVMDGLQGLGEALRLPLGEQVTGRTALEKVKELIKSRDAWASHMMGIAVTRQKLEAVEALLDEVKAVRDAVARHPDVMECSEYSDDEPVSCGWKRAYEDVVWALNGGKE